MTEISAERVATRARDDRATHERARIVGAITRQALGVLLVALACLWLAPIVWTVSTSLRTPAQSFSLPPKWLPTDLQLSNYAEVFVRVPFAALLFNSLRVS